MSDIYQGSTCDLSVNGSGRKEDRDGNGHDAAPYQQSDYGQEVVYYPIHSMPTKDHSKIPYTLPFILPSVIQTLYKSSRSLSRFV